MFAFLRCIEVIGVGGVGAGVKIRAKSCKIRAKFLKVFTNSLKLWANSLKILAKWRPKWHGAFFYIWRSHFWNFFGQVWKNSVKNPSHPKKLPAPTSMIEVMFVWNSRWKRIL